MERREALAFMNPNYFEIVVNAFCSEQLLGSTQYLRFFDNLDDLNQDFNNYKIQDEFDHSFIYYDSNSKSLKAYWKNKSGPIQFCGSAAFALCWLLNFSKIQKININSKFIESYFLKEETDFYLKFLAKEIIFLKESSLGKLYVNKDSGIFFLEGQEKMLKKPWSFFNDFIKQEKLINIHGFCVFCFNRDKELGKLRYFVPWHGRDEDSVTGSIHQYLTNFIGGDNWQHWKQKGELYSKLIGNEVYLKGQCSADLSAIQKFLNWAKKIQ